MADQINLLNGTPSDYWSKVAEGIHRKKKESKLEYNREYRKTDKYKKQKKKYDKRSYNKQDKEKRSSRDKSKLYGITQEDLKGKYADQNGRCKLCGVSKPLYAKRSSSETSLHVDHCHKTNKVRDLICSRCNLMVGLLETRFEDIIECIKYISRHKRNNLSKTELNMLDHLAKLVK